MAGDGDGRYRNGQTLFVRLSNEQHEQLIEVADGAGLSTKMREIFDAFAALPKKDQERFLNKVSAA